VNARDALLSRASIACVALIGLAMLGDDCQGDIVTDPTFRDWCGGSLCSWKTDYGQVQRVPTWNAEDLGVSFLDNASGDPKGTRISQVTQEDTASCILFTSVGNIDPRASMAVSVDFDNDGTIDAVSQLGSATWTQVQTEITAPAGYHGITFYVTKSGTGTAVLAEIRVQSTSGCSAPVSNMEQPFVLGDACGADAECAPGLVCAPTGLCSQCSATSPCEGGVACQQRSRSLPFQCGPGQGLGATSAPCLADGDCASGACDGATTTPLAPGDAGACDLDASSPDDAANCAGFSALGGRCK
jgi:hypothetical protein